MATFNWLPTTANFDCFSGETQTLMLLIKDATFMNFTYDASWCTTGESHYDDNGNLVCEITVNEANTTESERTAHITANSAGGTYTSVLTVKQAANRVKATPEKINFAGAGGEVVLREYVFLDLTAYGKGRAFTGFLDPVRPIHTMDAGGGHALRSGAIR